MTRTTTPEGTGCTDINSNSGINEAVILTCYLYSHNKLFISYIQFKKRGYYIGATITHHFVPLLVPIHHRRIMWMWIKSKKNNNKTIKIDFLEWNIKHELIKFRSVHLTKHILYQLKWGTLSTPHRPRPVLIQICVCVCKEKESLSYLIKPLVAAN